MRCKHRNCDIYEEFIANDVITVRDGVAAKASHAGLSIDPTGRFFVRCGSCGLERTYYIGNLPKWLDRYLQSSLCPPTPTAPDLAEPRRDTASGKLDGAHSGETSLTASPSG